jgi:hypothetical protein
MSLPLEHSRKLFNLVIIKLFSWFVHVFGVVGKAIRVQSLYIYLCTSAISL